MLMARAPEKALATVKSGFLKTGVWGFPEAGFFMRGFYCRALCAPVRRLSPS